MIAVAVSACLLGERVRYDGGHSLEAAVAGDFARVFRLIPDCPEIGIGLPAPRPRIQLRAGADGVRLVGATGEDLTRAMERFSADAAARYREAGVAGLILKARSPSCGTGDAQVAGGGADGTGIHAAALARALPEVPAISEAGLADPGQRDDWLTRVFALVELRRVAADRGGWYRFHARWKMTLMAHDEAATRRLGRALATGSGWEEYARGFMATLGARSTVGGHKNALQHLAGHLSGDGRKRATAAIEAFSGGACPLAAPIRWIGEARAGAGYLQDEAYLEPLPAPLRFRRDRYATAAWASTRR